MSARKSVGGHVDAPMLLGGTAIKPPERHGWERIRYILHNPETGEYLTRTPKSWLLIFIFYCIYYTCLAGFWYGMLRIFFLTVNEDSPKWLMAESIIGVNPGMGVRPRQAINRIDSSMYFFNGKWDGTETKDVEEDSDAGFAARMQHFLERTLVEGQPDAVVCSAEELNAFRAEGQPACKFDASIFGPCAQFPYGYVKDQQGKLSPCVIVKLNRIFGLKPVAYEPQDELSDEIPDFIKKQIQDPTKQRKIYISCHGENAADLEALHDNMRFYPEDLGIDLGFFPHQNKTNLVSPAIAIQFQNLPKGQLVHVECKAWFHGVKHDRKDRIGLAHFEIIVE